MAEEVAMGQGKVTMRVDLDGLDESVRAAIGEAALGDECERLAAMIYPFLVVQTERANLSTDYDAHDSFTLAETWLRVRDDRRRERTPAKAQGWDPIADLGEIAKMIDSEGLTLGQKPGLCRGKWLSDGLPARCDGIIGHAGPCYGLTKPLPEDESSAIREANLEKIRKERRANVDDRG